jgi:TatD DNase family protein
LADAKNVGVKKFISIGASRGLESCKQAIELSESYENIYASIGVHPHDAGKTSLEEVKELATRKKVVAIGETGLDFFRDWSPFDEQRKLFRASIELAKELKKPLIIHCRDANDDTVSILKELQAREVGGVFHCYSGSAEFAKALADMNFRVSLTGIITFKSAHALRAEIAKIPLEQILLETDCPYMAPEPFRGKPAEPMHVYQIALKLAEIKGCTVEEIAKITERNVLELFGI